MTAGRVLLVVLATILAATAAWLRPGDRERVLDAYLLGLGALAMVALVRATEAAVPRQLVSEFDRAAEHVDEPREPLADLARVERALGLGAERAYDLHVRLAPMLRDVAAHRLAARGIDLERNPDAARRALGDEAWEVARPDREPPDDRFAAGLPLATARAVVDRIERL